MTEKELKTALNKLLKIIIPKKFGEQFFDIEVVDVNYTPDVHDISDDGEWISGDVYVINVKSDSIQTLSDLKKMETYITDLVQSLVGKSNWISIHFE